MSRNKNKLNKPNESSVNNKADFDVFLTVFSYCILIIVLPVVTFFASKKLFESFDFTSISSNIWSAVSAVICLHLALGLYLYKAYSEGEKPKPSHQVKQD